ncbi:MAG: hypothetical protein NTNFB02_14480 [Nitrospira sp.]
MLLAGVPVFTIAELEKVVTRDLKGADAVSPSVEPAYLSDSLVTKEEHHA